MAFKIKDNLDLYGNQLLNFALQSDSGFPQSPQVGHIFNYTGTGVMANHAVMCVDETTKAFKALAFVDEIATNTAFTELVSRVTDLETALGTDEKDVLDTWEEVKTFLASIKESDGDLMTMLNSKLDMSGGTIDGSLQIGKNDNTSYKHLILSRSSHAMRFNNVADAGYISFGAFSGGTYTAEKIFEIGDYGLRYSENGGSTYHTLIHSGNIGSQSVNYATTAGNANALNGISANNYAHYTIGSGYIGFSINDHTLNPFGQGDGYIEYYDNGAYYNSVWGWVMALYGFKGNADSATKLQTKRTIWGQEFDGTGNVRGGLFDISNQEFIYSSGTWTRVGNGTAKAGLPTYIDGNDVSLRYGKTTTTGLILNSSGNVLIGDTEDKGAKLQVAGTIVSESITHRATIADNAIAYYNKTNGGFFLYGGIREGEALSIEIAGNTGSWVGNGITLKQNGNVGIGTPDPKKKLHVVGDLYVDGNIIATKEVSAGGAGQEGESGDGGAEVISQPIPSGVTTYTITNTIKRSDIAVSLYEANVINGQTIWSLCLADIEVTDATITVTFGSATSVNHKLVAVG